MHAVIVSVTITDGEKATATLRDEIVPRVKEAPGFVAGYWVRIENADAGRATIVFESEDGARAVAEQISALESDATIVESVQLGEVVESA